MMKSPLGLEERRQKKLIYKREYYRKWRKDNPDKVTKSIRKWRQINPEKSKQISNNWKRKYPEKHAAINAKRKASKLNRTVSWANKEKIQWFYDEAKRLSIKTGIAHHVDHVIPLQGVLCSGLHVEDNLQILTAVENMKKGNRYEH